MTREEQVRALRYEFCLSVTTPRGECLGCPTCLAVERAIDAGIALERAATVKWLRVEGSPAMAGYDQKLADSIEQGLHLDDG